MSVDGKQDGPFAGPRDEATAPGTVSGVPGSSDRSPSVPPTGGSPSARPSSPPPGGGQETSGRDSYWPESDEADGDTADGEAKRPDPNDRGRRRMERLLRETVRRGLEKSIEAGLGTISKTDTALRDLVGDVKLPKEIVSYAFSQVDETKNALVRVVAREVREFLDATDVAQEVQRALTSLSFEIKTEIRFIPNDAGTGVKPQVKAKAAPKRARGKRKDRGGQAEDPDDESTESEG